MDYPKLQWSSFVGGRDGDQLVVRGDDFEQFVLDIDQVKKEFIQHEEVKPEVKPKFGGIKYTCNTCGSEATLQEGINKNGNSYKLVKCTKDYKHNKFL